MRGLHACDIKFPVCDGHSLKTGNSSFFYKNIKIILYKVLTSCK